MQSTTRSTAGDDAARDPAHGPGPPLIGVLGGIASGKSAVARILAGESGACIDADAIAHRVLASPEISALVGAEFGEQVLDAAGRPDRARLAAEVFRDPARRALLEGWIHPRVRETISAELEAARTAGRRPIVLDVPLLLENEALHGLVVRCTALVFVDAPLDARSARAVRDRGWNPDEVPRREAQQLPLDEKRRRATHVLANDSTFDALLDAAARLRAELLG